MPADPHADGRRSGRDPQLDATRTKACRKDVFTPIIDDGFGDREEGEDNSFSFTRSIPAIG